MRKTALYILTIAIVLLTGSCDSKWDENGDLDGMWQMTEWRDKATNNVVKTNADSLYYCFQLKLMKIQNTSKSPYYFSYFTHSGDELKVGKTYQYPDDKEVPLTDLSAYGVPTDGRFHIDVLNNKNMVLSSTTSTLSFRKY